MVARRSNTAALGAIAIAGVAAAVLLGARGAGAAPNECPDPVAGNQLANPDFESGTDGWTVVLQTGITGQAGLDVSDPLCGQVALHVSLDAATQAGNVIVYQELVAIPGDVWKVGGWLLGLAYDGAEGQVQALFRDADNNILDQHVARSDDLSGSYRELGFQQVVAPAGAALLEVQAVVRALAPGASGEALFDAMYAALLEAGPTGLRTTGEPVIS